MSATSVDQDEWRDALLADLAHEAALLPGRRLTSIFFGGGTPSLMPPATVAALIEAARGALGLRADDIEITLEANPSSVEAARFADLARAGVNRVSLGLQSLDDAALRFLGRAHRRDEGLAALGHRAVGVRPGQLRPDLRPARASTEAPGRRARPRALPSAPTISRSTSSPSSPARASPTMAAKRELDAADPDDGAALFELTQELTAAAGLPAYEISNHARPGEESRHNLAYWRYQDYAGVGPGAHGRRGGMRTRAPQEARELARRASPATATAWSRRKQLTGRRGGASRRC